MIKKIISWDEFFERLSLIDKKEEIIYGIPNGGMIITSFLKNATITHQPELATLILDDYVYSGDTLRYYHKQFPNIKRLALFDVSFKGEIVFPWMQQSHPKSLIKNVIAQLEFIGEDICRDGLIDTPKRVQKMYMELFRGYNQKPEDIITVFDSDKNDEIIILKDIEFYSMCEHHMLPFIGKAHVAYIPGDKIVGISKLARLVDIYARRLQIQERIGEQVTSAIMHLLNAQGAACIIEAEHLCMKMRGVNKQNSVMTTSSLKGAFRDNLETRNELMQLINRK